VLLSLLTAEQAMLYSRTGTTPKFFVMCLFISVLFLAVVSWSFYICFLKYAVFFFKTHIQFVVSVHFGSYYNTSQEQELIMLSRLIA
jgi:hypothetical protein